MLWPILNTLLSVRPVFPNHFPKAHNGRTYTPFALEFGTCVATAYVQDCAQFRNLMLGWKGIVLVNILVLETLPLIRKGCSSVSAKPGASPSENLATLSLPPPQRNREELSHCKYPFPPAYTHTARVEWSRKQAVRGYNFQCFCDTY